MTTTKKEALRKASENAEKNSTVQNDEERLTDWEVERIAERLGTAMGHDDEFVGLLMLLLNHLSLLDDGPTGYVYTTIFTAKQHLFIGCKDADKAQERFETNAWANRRDLMLSQTSNPTPHKS